MPQATHANTTSIPIADDFADIAARMKGASATAPVEDPDAELIRLCDRLVQLQETISAAYDESLTDTEIEAAVAPHTAEYFAIRDRVVAIGLAKTQAGGLAVARAAYAMGQRWSDGAIITNGFSDWMAFAAVQALSGGGGEPAPRPDWHP